MRMRDIAQRVGITERAVQGIVSDLTVDGYIEKERHGRRNSYSVARGRPYVIRSRCIVWSTT